MATGDLGLHRERHLFSRLFSPPRDFALLATSRHRSFLKALLAGARLCCSCRLEIPCFSMFSTLLSPSQYSSFFSSLGPFLAASSLQRLSCSLKTPSLSPQWGSLVLVSSRFRTFLAVSRLPPTAKQKCTNLTPPKEAGS